MTSCRWFRISPCVWSPERSDVVAGGPAQDEAPLWVRAPLADLVRAACRPRLTHTNLGLLLEVVGWPENAEAGAPVWQAHKKTQTELLKTCAYLALAITRMSVNRKRCRSWVCIPVLSWTCPCRRNNLSRPARKDWTSGQVSGHTGGRKLSLEPTKTWSKSSNYGGLKVPKSKVYKNVALNPLKIAIN